MKLRSYQEKAADFLYENDRAMILAPVGAGKTALTLTAMEICYAKGLLNDGLYWLLNVFVRTYGL